VNRNALVTGAHGFVGARLCEFLLRNDWRLIAGGRRALSEPNIPGATQAYLPLSVDPQRWQASLQSVDCVVHLAAHVHEMGRKARADDKFNEINVEGSRFVAEQCARAGVKRLVFLSSLKVNGEGGTVRAYHAEDIPDPQDAYARSKLGAEMAIQNVCSSAGVEWVIIRAPLVYGPGVRANFRRLMQAVGLGVPLPLGSIDNRRSLVGLGNLVDFIHTCMTHPDAAGRIWLISDGEDLSTAELVGKLSRLMNKPARLLAIPPRWLRFAANALGLGAEMSRLCESLVVDSTPARERLDWRPITSLDEGLARTVDAFKAERGR